MFYFRIEPRFRNSPARHVPFSSGQIQLRVVGFLFYFFLRPQKIDDGAWLWLPHGFLGVAPESTGQYFTAIMIFYTLAAGRASRNKPVMTRSARTKTYNCVDLPADVHTHTHSHTHDTLTQPPQRDHRDIWRSQWAQLSERTPPPLNDTRRLKK